MDLLKFLDTQIQKKAVGTLTLGKKKCFREVFFQGELMYLVGEHFSGKVAVARLAEAGIPGSRMNPKTFEAVLQEMDRTRRLLPQVLHDQEVLDDAELKAVAEEHLREEVTDLLFNNPGSFHFQEGRVPEYLLKCEEITVRVPISIRDVLTELRRRKELLALFDSLVPSREEIFVLTEKGMAFRQAPSGSVLLIRVLELIDGLRDLQTLLKDTYLYEFQVIAHIVKALEEGYIKKTIHPELKGLATHTFKREDAERYLPWFKNAVKYGSDELAARERLAVVYEKLGKLDEAVIQYNYIGDTLYRMRTAAKAIKAYQKALMIKPGEILITEKITRIYTEAANDELESGNATQAIQFLEGALRIRPDDRDTFSQALQILLREKKLEELSALCDWICSYSRKARSPETGIHACKEVLRELPQNAAFRKKLINLYLDFGHSGEASAEMQTLAMQYLERGQNTKAQELIDKIRRVGAGPSDTRLLEKHMSVLGGRERTRALPRLFLAFGLFFVSYQAWSYTAWRRILTGPGTAEAASRSETVKNELVSNAEEVHCARLSAKCDSFLHEFPFSLLRGEAENMKNSSLKRGEELTAARTERKRRILESAKASAREGERAKTVATLGPLLALPEDDGFRIAAEELRAEVLRHEESAAALLERAVSLEREGDISGAYKTFRALLDHYPGSMLTRDVKLPVLIESVPPGAEVVEILDSGEKVPMGPTPRVTSISPGGSMQLELSSPGHLPLRTEVQEGDSALRIYMLLRRPAWSLSMDGRVEGKPVLAGGRLICCTSHGTFFGIDASVGKVIWTQRGDPLKTAVGPPIVSDDGIYTLWNNGRLVYTPAPFDAKPPGARDSERATELFLGSLATSPLHAITRSQLLAVGTKSGQIQAYHRKPPSLAWTLPIDEMSEILASVEEDLLVGTRSGFLLRARTNPPSLSWKRQICPAGIQAVLEAGRTIVAATSRNDLIFLKADSGEVTRTLSLSEGSRMCLSPEDGKVFTIEPGTLISEISPETAEVIRKEPIAAAFESVVPLRGAIGILRPGRKSFIIVDSSTLKASWAAETSKPITHLVADDNWVVAVSEDGRVTAFRRS